MAYDTYYRGTGAIIVSQSPTETERAKEEIKEVRQTMQIMRELDYLDFMKKEAMARMTKPLKSGAVVDLLAIGDVGPKTMAAYTQGMLTALQKLQSKNIAISGRTEDGNKGYSTEQDVADAVASDITIIKDVENFVKALQAMYKTFDNAATRKWIDESAWLNIRNRFIPKSGKGRKGPDQELYAAFHNILKGQSTNPNQDMARVFNQIRGDFGNNLGKLMEGLIRYLAETPAVKEQIEKSVADYIIKDVKGDKSLGSGGAMEGTIRAHLVDAKYDKTPTKKQYSISGNRLRDTQLTVTPNADGKGGKITWGVSVKQYNFHSTRNTKGEIKLAELSLANFSDVFARIRRKDWEQRKTSRGNNALYGYRLLSAAPKNNSDVLLYVLSHRVAEITFGSKIGALWGDSGKADLGGDTAELMVINGKMMNTADVIGSGDLKVTTTGFPKGLDGGWWDPSVAIDNVHKIHQAKLVTMLEFGKDNAISRFG